MIGGAAGATGSRDGPRGWSLLWKAAGLFALIAAAPAAATLVLLSTVNRDAVETSERQLQSAVLSEVSARVLRAVQTGEDDTIAVSSALSEAARHPESIGDATAAVRAILASRRGIDAVRFEVPSVGVNTVIARGDTARRPVPTLDRALAARADEHGLAFATLPDGDGIVVVPVRGVSGAKGYVTSRVVLDGVRQLLEDTAAARFENAAVHIVVADDAHRAVASFGVPGVEPGDDVRGLPVWRVLPDGNPWRAGVSVISPHTSDGVAMVGGVQTVPELGWAVALWRTEESAYASLTALKRQTAYVGVGALLLAALLGLLAGRTVVRPVVRMVRQTRLIGERRWREVRVDTARTDELGQLATSIRTMAADLEASEEEIEKQARLRGDLSRFLSRDLVNAIVRGEHPLSLGGRRSEVTVLFADVVAFTPLAESRPPEQVVALLNELFSMLTEIVFRHDGMVDKFIGDCIMAVWGAARPTPDHARLGLAAARDMVRFLETANESWKAKYDVEIRLGIGVNSGDALVGNIGSDKRMEFTVVGDVVNVAARLEAIARPNQVLVGEGAQIAGGEAFDLEPIGERNLTGRKAPSKVYSLID